VEEQKTPHVTVVEASAGSGKTYELARRYIRLILASAGGTDTLARSTLAITFTNKASIEMKERILELLKKLALDGFASRQEKGTLLDFLGMDETRARHAARGALDSLIRNYNFFQVQTIDSFINAILSGCAFRLDLAADFRIRTDSSRHIAFGLDSLIEKAAADEKTRVVLLEYLRQYIFLENRAGWFPKADLLTVISLMFLDANAYAGDFLRYPARKDEIFDKRKKIVALMEELRNTEPPGANQVVFKSFRSRMDKFARHMDIGELCRPFAAAELPLRKNQAAAQETLELWRRIRASIGNLFETESLSLFNGYIDLFDMVAAEVRARASDENVMFLPELNRKARLLFDGGMTVPELYYRLATRFRHYLIDEFQDTSVLQWKNLYLMLEEALSTGGSFFYVGDKKQAIFRFRGGDASLFHKVARDFQPFSVRVDYLTRNYRSLRSVVEFNNRVFSRENLERFLRERGEAEEANDEGIHLPAPDTKDILDIFDKSAQSADAGPGGTVRIVPIDADTNDEADARIREELLALIAGLRRRRGSYQGIAVLSRANLDIEKITAWLLEAHIPVESEKTLNVREHPLVKEIVSFLIFLNSPINDLAFASFILGDIFTRASGLSRSEIEDFLFQRARRGGKENAPYLYREFRDAFPGPWESLIEEFFRTIGFVPLYELSVSIYARFGILANFPHYQGFLMKFLEIVRKQVSEEDADCASFLEFFAAAPNEELYVNVAETDAVKVLSIHKSKGLGFDEVILPFLEISIDVGGRGGRPYLIDENGDEGIRLLKINKETLAFSDRLSRIYTGEYKRLLIDELNTVYVALTRARRGLYAFMPKKCARGYNYCRLLIPEDEYARGEESSAPSSAREPAGQRLAPPGSEYRNWIPYLKEEFIDKGEVQNRTRILDGTVIHCALSRVYAVTDGAPDPAISEALAHCRAAFPLYPDFERVEAKLRAILSAQHLRRFFYTERSSVACEKEICDRTGALKRLDRVITGADETVIIDYKSSAAERDRGLAQMAEYLRLAAGTYAKPARGFLLYLDTLELEEAHGTG